jgi:predicted alpha/beta hydrolase family esterase
VDCQARDDRFLISTTGLYYAQLDLSHKDATHGLVTPVLIVPGWQSSGPAHWQSLWQLDHPEFARVEQSNWSEPDLADWVATLERAIVTARAKPLLVAHSLGCITVAHWAGVHDLGAESRLAGALLVAPADVEESVAAQSLENFAPIPQSRLRFASIVVGSRNDQYASFERAQLFAAAWGSEFVDAGFSGHINTDAGFGPWSAGEALLARLR